MSNERYYFVIEPLIFESFVLFVLLYSNPRKGYLKKPNLFQNKTAIFKGHLFFSLQ